MCITNISNTTDCYTGGMSSKNHWFRGKRAATRGYVIGYVKAMQENGVLLSDVSLYDLSEDYLRILYLKADKETYFIPNEKK